MSTPTIPQPTLQQLFPASPTNYYLAFAGLPELNLVIQEVTLPGFTTQPTRMAIPGHTAMLLVPDKISYDPLIVTFLIDEEYRTHRELHQWMARAAGSEDRTRMTAAFVDDQLTYTTPDPRPAETFGRLTQTTAGLTIVNGAKIPVLRIAFVGIRPVNVTGISLDVRNMDTNVPLTATATFEYDYYTILELPR